MNMFKFRPVTMTVKRLGIWAPFIETTGHHSLSHNVKIMNGFLFILKSKAEHCIVYAIDLVKT